MLGPAFGQGSGLHQLFVGDAVGRVDAGDLEGALGQGAGLIKHHDAGAGQLLQIGGALDQDAAGGSTADAAEEAQRNADDQCAGAADDQEGQGAVDPVPKAGRLAHQQQHDGRQEGQRQRTVADSRSVYPGKAGDEVFGAGLFHAGIFHQIENFRDGGLAEFLGGPDSQQAGHVHAAADDLVSGLDVAGQALTGQGGGVQGGGALYDHTVNGHPLAGLHHDHGADLHVIRVHLLQLAVLVLHVGVVRADVHQAGNALAALAHGHALEQLADLVKEDNGAAFHIVAQGKGTHGSHRHQEALVKGLAVLDALDGLAQHVLAHHKVRDEVEQQLHRGRKCRQHTEQQLEEDHKGQRDQDLLQALFLLFGHTKRSFCQIAAVLRKNGKTQWNSTSFPQKNGFSTLSPVFSTGFSRRKLAFPRFFLEFSAKGVEKCVESVENCPFFPRKRGVFRCPAAEERKALPQGESCRPAAMPGTGPEEVRCQRSRSRPPPSCRRTAHSPWWRGGRHPRQTPPSSSGS